MAGITAHLRSATSRLALTYLSIIMLMSIGFSIVFYNTSYHQLGRQGPPINYSDDPAWPLFRQDIDDFLNQRINEARKDLLLRLVAVNMMALGGGAIISYYLARRTMEPIEQSVEAQNRFVSDASHELRTPLTAIQTSNEVTLRKPKLSISEARDVIRQNTEDVIKLEAIANSLLQLAKNGDGQALDLKPTDIKKAVAEAFKQASKTAKAKNIKLDDKSLSSKIVANQPALTQALSILLDNAIKYSQSDSTVTVGGKNKGKLYEIQVVDSGDGIAEDDQPFIFQRFYRADKSRSDQNGYGLGLSIAETLIHQQNGEIWLAKSHAGKGSTFAIRLPLHSA